LKGSATLFDGKRLVAVCRIKPLRRMHCCALAVCGLRLEQALNCFLGTEMEVLVMRDLAVQRRNVRSLERT